jgi:two-component system nitrate/nitrite response regulator NarL
MRRTRLVIADRYPVVLQGLTSLFAAQYDFKIVASCSDGTSCIEAMRNLAPDVAILDVSMPNLTGLEILAIANTENLSTRLVFFTASVEHRELVAATAAGACSVIPKDATPEMLVQSLREVADDWRLLKRCRRRECAGGADGPRARDHASGIRRIVQQGNCAPTEHLPRHDQSAPPSHVSEA